jgi:hypothetical protein
MSSLRESIRTSALLHYPKGLANYEGALFASVENDRLLRLPHFCAARSVVSCSRDMTLDFLYSHLLSPRAAVLILMLTYLKHWFSDKSRTFVLASLATSLLFNVLTMRRVTRSGPVDDSQYSVLSLSQAFFSCC